MSNPGLVPWPLFISTEENQTSPKFPCVHESEDETKNLGTDNRPRLCQWPIYRISGINQGNYIVVAVENSKEYLCPTGHHLLLLTQVTWRGAQRQRVAWKRAKAQMAQAAVMNRAQKIMNGKGKCGCTRDCGINECRESWKFRWDRAGPCLEWGTGPGPRWGRGRGRCGAIREGEEKLK